MLLTYVGVGYISLSIYLWIMIYLRDMFKLFNGLMVCVGVFLGSVYDIYVAIIAITIINNITDNNIIWRWRLLFSNEV